MTGVSNDRLQVISKRGIEGAPDLVVEILSPVSAKQDHGPKKRIYTVSGVREYWIVDPALNTVTVFNLSRDPSTPLRTLGSDDILTTPLLDGLEIDLRDVFAD